MFLVIVVIVLLLLILFYMLTSFFFLSLFLPVRAGHQLRPCGAVALAKVVPIPSLAHVVPLEDGLPAHELPLQHQVGLAYREHTTTYSARYDKRLLVTDRHTYTTASTFCCPPLGL